MPGEFLDQPIFLMCSERCGSNLITKMFDAHPCVSAPGNAHLIEIFAPMVERYRGRRDDLVRDLLELFEARLSAWQLDDKTAADRIARLPDTATCEQMIARLFNTEAQKSGKQFSFVKENSIHARLPFIERMSVAPRYLFMVRDPRDMALSWQNAAALRGGIVRASRRWVADQSAFRNAIGQLRQTRRVSMLRYEDLVQDQETSLQRVCKDLELPFSEDMMDHQKNSVSSTADATRAAIWQNLSKPTMTDNTGKFKDHLDKDSIRLIEAICEPLMSRFGYDTVTPASEHLTPDALREALAIFEAREPWQKSFYQQLPQTERRRYERWSSLKNRLVKG